MIKSSLSLLLILTLYSQANMSFERWQQQQSRDFESYQTQMDREFIDMLKKEWQEYHSKKTLNPYNKPKPHQQPIYRPQPKPEKVITITPTIPQIEPMPKISPKNEMAGFKKVGFDFFGIDIEILYNQKLLFDIYSISNSSIANFWDKISSIDYHSLTAQIKEYQTIYRLDGWSSYLLVKEITKRVYPNRNAQNLMQWFILVKLGVDAKIGYRTDNISLLVCSDEKLYGVNFFRVNGKRYYNLSDNSIDLQIYKRDLNTLYPLAFLNREIGLPYSIKTKEIRFIYRDKIYLVDIPYNQNLTNLYQKYPQLPYSRYTKISSITQEAIYKQLQPIINSMSQIDAINFLLRLTQNGFRYKTDNENFGYEKVMFFEETLANKYSDCEDRAIFFYILVKKLLGLDIVFVKYPNHLATAIRLDSNIGGDRVIYQNQKYYIADPTYSSANIGQTMPQIRFQEVKIIQP